MGAHLKTHAAATAGALDSRSPVKRLRLESRAKFRQCIHTGCASLSRRGGLCRKHGAKGSVCAHKGCANNAVKDGVCVKHGAARQVCTHKGCACFAKKGGFCFKHRGEKCMQP